MRESVTETCLAIHPVQFWSVGISFVDIGLVLKILALTSLGNTSAQYRVCGRSDLICLFRYEDWDNVEKQFKMQAFTYKQVLNRI